MIDALRILTQASWDWQHVPRPFRTAKTVVHRKQRKEKYTAAKSWRPIALLNTLGKVCEAVTAKYLQNLAEDQGMLPREQMGARKGRSTETAIGLLLAQIRTVFKGKGVASVLSMDVSGAFDHVVRERLIDILRRKRVPESLVG